MSVREVQLYTYLGFWLRHAEISQLRFAKYFTLFVFKI